MTDAFETLGVEPRFDLDDTALADRHRALSKTLHPDRYAGKPAAERRMALDRAITVNEAFRALKDPIQRAESLLSRLGVKTGELEEPKPSPMLLMEMMEVREELAEAHKAKDLDRVGAVADRMREKERDVLSRLREGFAQVSEAGAAQELVPVLGELRYVRRFFEELDAIEEQLMDGA